MIRSAYLAAEGFEGDLAEELRRAGCSVSAWHGRLALSPDAPRHMAWALDIWTAPQEIAAPSVKAAADALRAKLDDAGIASSPPVSFEIDPDSPRVRVKSTRADAAQIEAIVNANPAVLALMHKANLGKVISIQ